MKIGQSNFSAANLNFSNQELNLQNVIETFFKYIQNPKENLKNFLVEKFGFQEIIEYLLEEETRTKEILPKNKVEESEWQEPKRLDVSLHGIELIKRHEGYRAKIYNDPAGNATIGYGHLVHKGKIHGKEPKDYFSGISQRQAEELLRLDLSSAISIIHKMTNVKLKQSQFDALVSFVYNVGGENFSRSTLLKKINLEDYKGAANEFPKWKYGGGKVLRGLVNRREEEKAMFLGA